MGIFDFRSRRDMKRLAERFPLLRDYEKLAAPVRELLRLHHRRYVSTVSSEDVVASLETCTFMYVLCDVLKPGRIADLGSGFSSFVFRTWAKQTDAPAEIWSVDDSDQWLAATREYLAGEGLSDEHVVSWDEFVAADLGRFDFVFHDIGEKIPKRIELFPKAMSLAGPGGAVVLDDVHKKKGNYRNFVRSALAEAGLDYYDLKSLLEDQYGRYAWLVLC